MANLKDINYGIGKYLELSDASGIPAIGANRKNLDLLNFKVATNNAYALYNFKDGMIDAYQTEAGVDTGTSTNDSYDSTNKTYGPTVTAAATTAFTAVATTSWTAPAGITSVDYLVVAGGGGGGGSDDSAGSGGSGYAAAGGGAGGLRTGTLSVTAGNQYTVTVGNKGDYGLINQRGGDGTDSVFHTVTSDGGGGGGSSNPTNTGQRPGADGGSGGGGTRSQPGGSGNTPSTSPAQGFDGGDHNGSWGSSGGGGASEVGENSSGNPGTAGGDGVDVSATFGTTYGVSGVFAGGGGGGSSTGTSSNINAGGPGGAGGGAQGGGWTNNAYNIPAIVNTGGGGGGGYGKGYSGGQGGTGIVLIKNAAATTNMTLLSNTQTAQADPTEGRLMLYEEDVDSVTPGTDIKGYVSRDGGTTWSVAVGLTDDGYLNAQGGIDTNTKLMLHMDGANDGTTFTDSSDSPYTVTPVGNIHTDTAVKKFGTASAQCDGTGDYLTVPYNADWNFGTNNWTIDFWTRFNVNNTWQCMLWFGYGTQCWFLDYKGTTNQLRLYMNETGAGNPNVTESWTPVVDTWYHMAGVRNGNNLMLFVDGTQLGSSTSVTGLTALNDTTGGPAVGGRITSGGATLDRYLNGYIDEVRVVNGTATWTSNFTPPNRQYTSGVYESSQRLLSGSVDISGQPAGSNMKYKIETLNNKNLKLHGASLLWA